MTRRSESPRATRRNSSYDTPASSARARQGSIRSPQWTGGGVVWGPHQRSFHQYIPRKMRRLAVRSALSAKVRNAGAIFLGPHTPEAIGDYVGGSNHVLPTARSARFSSGLGVLDFMKRTSILKCGPDQLRALGPAAMTLGKAEGLDAHSRSVGLRLNLP